MRILVATTPGWGHLHPTVPVAASLLEAGHTVLWVTAPDGCERLHGLGFDTAPTGMALAQRLPEAGRRLAAIADTVPPHLRRPHAFAIHFAELAAPAMLPGLRGAVEGFGPDVIVREPAELASPILAAAGALPVVTVGFGGLVPADARSRAAGVLAPLWDVEGAELPADGGDFGELYLHPMPPSMDLGPLPPVARRVRSIALDPPVEAVPGWVDGLGVGRPAVYATFGTEFGAMAPWPAVLEALGGLDVDAIATVGASGLPDGCAVPANVRVERYVEQAVLLPRVAAVLSHGGAGTMLGAAMVGVPQVCVPLGADQFENAAALAGLGAGVTVTADDRSAERMKAAVQAALGDPAAASAARMLADEMESLPPARQAVGWIEDLARP